MNYKTLKKNADFWLYTFCPRTEDLIKKYSRDLPEIYSGPVRKTVATNILRIIPWYSKHIDSLIIWYQN